MALESVIEGPAWDLTGEYSSPDSQGLQADLDRLNELLDRIEALNGQLNGSGAVAAAQQIHRLADQARELLADPRTYASCLLSVNGRDEAALMLQGRLQGYQTRFGDLLKPLELFIDLADDEGIEAFLADPEVAPAEFVVRHARKRRHERLGLAEEQLINGLSQEGIHAWGNLYDQLSGTLTCEVLVGNETREMGIAEAAGLLQKPDVATRRNAWRAINDSWSAHAETCAASLNAIAGWRLELGRRRGREAPVHFLDAPVHMNRISRETLDTLMDVAAGSRPLARRAARLMARAYGLETIGPWDQRAPAPDLGTAPAAGIPYDQALHTIADAYADVHPSMGEFVRMMHANRWIEGTRGPNKRPGAYCTGFAKSRTPRIYMTYSGGSSDVITLAHELGHALHSWVMRDLPNSQRGYGMALAETASTFGETLVRDALLGSAGSPQAKLDMAWEEMAALVSFVLNIPTRFEFERRFYEARRERPVLPRELNAMMADAWTECFGDVLEEPDPMFWASKLHFYISGISFYNFPYLFGYLFSLGVYARRGDGADFYPRYEGLLRDTGRMTAEALAAKHLSEDLSRPGFWEATVASLETRVDAFEDLLDELAL